MPTARFIIAINPVMSGRWGDSAARVSIDIIPDNGADSEFVYIPESMCRFVTSSDSRHSIRRSDVIEFFEIIEHKFNRRHQLQVMRG